MTTRAADNVRAIGKAHAERFKSKPAVFVAPGRVNLIGEHTDYSEGFVMPAAIEFATWAAVSPRQDDTISVYSEQLRRSRLL